MIVSLSIIFFISLIITLHLPETLHAQSGGEHGNIWKLSNKGLPDTNTIVRDFTVSGKMLFCAVFGAGVYRSSDNGMTWKASNKGLKNFDIWSLVAHKNILFAATTGGLFRSTNNGQTWEQMSVNADAHALLITDKTTVVGSLDSIIISTDNQKTWRTRYRDNQNWFVKTLVANGTTIFAGTSGGIVRSTDGGETWSAANTGLRVPIEIWAMAVSNGVVCAATADGIYHSVDNGESWVLTPNRENTRSLIAVGGVLYAGAIGAVLRSEDNGAHWQISHEGLPNLILWGLARIGKMMFAGTTDGVYSADESSIFGKEHSSKTAQSGGERIIAEPILRATAVHAASTGEIRTEEPLRSVRIEEFLSDKVHSLLNYIFFDENSTYIPLRYKQISPQQTKDFRPELLIHRETLEVYYDILNIIGYRMQQHTKATLTIVGCNAQSGFETTLPELSLRRAQAVQQYLASVWRIPASRLYVEFRDLPEKPSRQNDTYGDQENRRVELYSSWDILRPVQYTDTLREATPAVVRFRPYLPDTAGVVRWKMSVEQNGRTLVRWASGNHAMPHILDWHIGKKQLAVPLDTAPIQCRFEVAYKRHTQPVLSRLLQIPIERITHHEKQRAKRTDVRKNRYNLILFDIASDKVSGVNERIVAAIRAANVFSSSATVRVIGYTDMIGADDANLHLSARRAESVAQTLGITPGMVASLTIKGRGEEPPLLYENDTPEGRFYCRAVIIELDAPVQYE